MKKQKNSDSHVENGKKRLKRDEKPEEEEEKDSRQDTNSEGEEDAITSTLKIQNDTGKMAKFSKRSGKRLIVVLENANLETVKVGQTYELLNCDKHKQQIIKYKKLLTFYMSY